MPEKVLVAHLDVVNAHDFWKDYYKGPRSWIDFIGAAPVGYHSSVDCWLVSEEVANRIKLLTGPNGHAILKAMEARHAESKSESPF